MPASLHGELRGAKDGGSVAKGLGTSRRLAHADIHRAKTDALGKHIHITNEEAGRLAIRHEIEPGSAEHNRLMEHLRAFGDQIGNIRMLTEQLETRGMMIKFSQDFGALGIRFGDTVYLEKNLLEEGVLRGSPETGVLLEGLLYQQWTHDSTLDVDPRNEFIEEVVAVMFESLVYLRALQEDPELLHRIEKFLQERLGIQNLEHVITDELLEIAREMRANGSPLYSEEIGITKEGINRLIGFVKRYYPEYQGLRLPSDIVESVSEKRDLLLLRTSLAKMRWYHQEELDPVGEVEPWDYILLAAASDKQKRAFEAELRYRRSLGFFAPKTKFRVVAPPENLDSGTGGAVLNALRVALQDIAMEQEAQGEAFRSLDDLLKEKKILIMLSGGPSKRIPIFSAVGKAFTPMPVPIEGLKETPLTTTLFDELYMMLSGAAAKMTEGIIVIPGDAQMIFDWEGLSLEGKESEGFVEVVWRAPAEEAVTHGVRITGAETDVMQFSIEKKSVDELRRLGAIDRHGLVNLSTALIKGDRDVARRLAELGGLRVQGGVLIYDRESDIVMRAIDQKRHFAFDWFGDFLPALGEKMAKEEYVSGEKRGLKGSIWEKFREGRPVTYHVRSTSPFLFADFGTTDQAQDHLISEDSMIRKVYEFKKWSNAHIAAGASVSGSALIYDAVIIGLREFEVRIEGVPVTFTTDSSETIVRSTDPTLEGATLNGVDGTIRKVGGDVVEIESIKRETYQGGFVGKDSIVTMSQLSGDFKIGENCFVYMVDDPSGKLRLADHVVAYQVPVRINGIEEIVNVVYGAQVKGGDGRVVREADDPKGGGARNTLFGEEITTWLRESGLSPKNMIRHIWPGIPEGEWSLWNARLYAPGDNDFYLTNWMMEPRRRSAPSRWLQMMRAGELMSMEDIAQNVDYAALVARRKAVRENEFLRIPTYVDAHIRRAWKKSLSVTHTVDYDPQDDTKQKGAVVEMISNARRVSVGIGEDHAVVRTSDFAELPLGYTFDPSRQAILNENGRVVARVLWIDDTFRRTEVTSREGLVVRYDPRREDPTKPRIPQTAEVMQPIAPGGFHLKDAPTILVKPLNQREFRIAATKVPIFRNSFLLVSDELRPQVMLRNDVKDALAMLRNTSMVVWFNSLGAAASVNDFHLQGAYTADFPLGLKRLPVDEAEVSHVANVGSVKIGYLKNYHAQAMVFTGEEEEPLAEVAYRYINFLQERNLPHNLIFIKGKVIVFVKNRDRLITRLGINPAAPELSGIITLSDPQWMGHPPEADFLREGLAESTVSRKALIQLFREFMSQYFVDEGMDVDDRLQAALQSRKEGKIRRYLFQKLSGDGFEATLAFIRGLLETGEDRYHEGAIHALGYLGTEGAIKVVKKFHKDPRNPIRVAVVRALGKVRGKGAIPELVEMLEDDYFGVHLEAAYVLGESGDKEATSALVKKLNERKPGTLALKEKLARAIGKIGDVGEGGKAVKALILQSQHSPYETLRRASVWALGELNYGKRNKQRDAAVQELKERSQDARISVRVAAVRALTKIGREYAEAGQEIGHSFIQRLDEEKDWQVRETLVRGVGELRDEDGLDLLNKIMKDGKEDLGVRAAAVYALSRFEGHEKAEGYLMGVMRGVTRDDILAHAKEDAWVMRHLDPSRRTALLTRAGGDGLGVSWKAWGNKEARRLLRQQVRSTLETMDREGMVKEIWERAGYWAFLEDKPERLGWQRLPDEMAKELEDIQNFVDEIKGEGMTDVVVIGMGGATQGIYTYRETFGEQKGIRIHILDTTSPRAVQALEERLDLDRTIFIFSSKAGAVPEGNANFHHFWAKVESHFGEGNAGKAFVALTNPDFPLDLLAKKLKFRKVFYSKLDTGGRFEALSMEMLVMASILGVDTKDLLDRINANMIPRTRRFIEAKWNPAAHMAAVLEVLRRRGHDTLTLVTSESLKEFKPWLEQLISESLGKDGKGILPTSGEDYDGELAAKGFYKNRVFILVRTEGEALDVGVRKDLPVIDIVLPEKESLGELFYLWEFATALQGRLMNINPFDAPAVIGSKQRASEYVDALMQGTFQEEAVYAVSNKEGSVTLDYGTALRQEFGISESDLDMVLERMGAARDDIAAVYAAVLYLSRKAGKEYGALLPYMASTHEEKEAWRKWQSVMHPVGFSTYTGEGPRFQHSALQFFMDGPNTGVHTIVAFDNDRLSLPIHDPKYPTLTYGQFIRAQSLGTTKALEEADRVVLRFGVQESESSGMVLRDIFEESGRYLASLMESEYLGEERFFDSTPDGGRKTPPFPILYSTPPVAGMAPLGELRPSPKFFGVSISIAEIRTAIEDAFYNTPLLQDTMRKILKRPSFSLEEITNVTIAFLSKEIIMSRVYLVTVKHRYGESKFILDVDRVDLEPTDEKPPVTHSVLENLRQAHEADPRYVVEPFAKGAGKVRLQTPEGSRDIEIPMATKESLEGWDNLYIWNPVGQGIRTRSDDRKWQIKEEHALFMKELVKILTLYYLKLGQRAIKLLFNHGDFMVWHPAIKDTDSFSLGEAYGELYRDESYIDLKGAYQNVKLVSIAGLQPMDIPEYIQYLLTYIQPVGIPGAGREAIFDPDIVWKGIEEALREVYGEEAGERELQGWKESREIYTLRDGTKVHLFHATKEYLSEHKEAMEVIDLGGALEREGLWDIGRFTEDDRHSDKERPLIGKWNLFYIAEIDREPIGYFVGITGGGGYKLIEKFLGVFVYRLSVHREYRGKGIGTLLMRKIAEAVQGDNKAYLSLETWDENRDAQSLYERLGFRKVGEHFDPGKDMTFLEYVASPKDILDNADRELAHRGIKKVQGSSQARDGGRRNVEGEQPFTWPAFSFEGEEAAERGAQYWKGRLRVGGEEFSVTLGSSDVLSGMRSVLFRVYEPGTMKEIAFSEWTSGSRPWIQRVTVKRPEYRGSKAEVRLADVLMAIRLSDMTGFGSSFEKLHASVTLRPEGEHLGSFGSFPRLEQIGLRPDPKTLTGWADRLKVGHAKTTLQHQLRTPRELQKDTPHLRISWAGGALDPFKSFDIELFFVKKDGDVVTDGRLYQRLSSDPEQVEAILRKIAAEGPDVTVEEAPYHVWVGGTEYTLNPDKLPQLMKMIALLPRVPWAPAKPLYGATRDRQARDGGSLQLEVPSRWALEVLYSP